MNVVTVWLLVGLVLADTYVVQAQNHLLPPLPKGECGEADPKANGLTSILNDFSETFPTYEFLGTFLEALSDDEEVVQVMSLLMTDNFNHLINKIGDIDQWVEITDIFCDDLQFNINFYLKVLGDLFKVIPIDTSTPKSAARSRPGIIGLIHEIIDILPLDEWQPKFNVLVDYNEDVQIAIDTLKGDLFKTVVTQTLQMEEFKILSEKLKAFRLPVDCAISELQKKLGWPFNTCACGIVGNGTEYENLDGDYFWTTSSRPRNTTLSVHRNSTDHKMFY